MIRWRDFRNTGLRLKTSNNIKPVFYRKTGGRKNSVGCDAQSKQDGS